MSDPLRVLHVDDEAEFADLTATFLQRESDRITVETATSASEGLERLAEESFDCIVSDFEMPGENGIEFLTAVRESHPDLPFILFTGRGSEEVASDAISAGATDYLQKGSTDRYGLLANRIENVVEQHRERERRTDLEQARALVSEVTQALVRASSREELERRVCRVLTDADPYRVAFFADFAPETGTFEPRTRTGDAEAVLDALGAEATAVDHPVARAVQDGEVTVTPTDQTHADAPWQAAATDQGLRSLAVVPVAYADERYGVFGVFSDRADAFNETERAVLGELGDDIGHAFASFEAHDRLSSEMERYRLLADSAMDAIITIDADSEIQFANPAVEEVFGYAPAELVGESLTKLMPDRHHERHREAVERFLQTGERTIDWSLTELPGVRKDGEEIELSISFGTFEQGGERYFQGIIRDVTERKRRQRELETYETIVETVQDGIYALNGDGEFVVVNGAFAELIGYDREELLGRTASELRPAGWDRRFEELQASLDAGSSAESVEIHTEAADGSTRYLDARYAPFPGEESGRVGVLRDVTGKREREQRLERYREYTERVFDAIDDLFFVLDEAGSVLRYNDAVVEVTGYPEEAVSSMNALEFIPDSHHDRTLAAIAEVFQTGHARLEAPLLTREGETIPYEFAADQVVHPDGEPRLVGVGRDVSERAEQERELRRRNERLAEFANIVSHDLRNPLSVAEGRIELASEECDSDHLAAAADAVARSQTLVDDLLTLAREGDGVAETELLDLHDVVEGCWQNVPTGEATLRTEGSPTVRAERSRLEQLLENLIRNAVEHGRADATVTVGALDDGFYIADDGEGIPEGRREAVFEPGHSTASEGTGYGLAIVQQVADAHGWSVRVTESETGGARFEITGVETE